MRVDPYLPRFRKIVDVFLMPAASFHDLHPRAAAFDHIISVFPRHGEWHVLIDPPVVTRPRGSDPGFPENGALLIETSLQDACEVAERVANVARSRGRSAIVLAKGVLEAAEQLAWLRGGRS